MYFPAKQPASVDALVEHYHRSLDALNKCMVWQGNALTLLPGTDISNTLAPGQLARVESGLVYVNWGARTAFILQPGDFIFHFNTLKEKSLAYLAEETVKIKCINAEHLSTQLTSHTEYLQHWHNFLLIQSTIFANAYGSDIKQGIRPDAGFKRYTAGETIVAEGMPAEHVYTLLKGVAKVTIKNTPVGIVNEGEIFGALAAITGKVRNATVLAHSNCTVMAVPKEQFIDIIRSQPETCLQMIQTMAAQITELNSRVSSKVESIL